MLFNGFVVLFPDRPDCHGDDVFVMKDDLIVQNEE